MLLFLQNSIFLLAFTEVYQKYPSSWKTCYQNITQNHNAQKRSHLSYGCKRVYDFLESFGPKIERLSLNFNFDK